MNTRLNDASWPPSMNRESCPGTKESCCHGQSHGHDYKCTDFHLFGSVKARNRHKEFLRQPTLWLHYLLWKGLYLYNTVCFEIKCMYSVCMKNINLIYFCLFNVYFGTKSKLKFSLSYNILSFLYKHDNRSMAHRF